MCEHNEILQLFMEVGLREEVSERHRIRKALMTSQCSSVTLTRLYFPLAAAASPQYGAVDADFPEAPLFIQ